MPLDDAWDWPFLLYFATVTLKRSEREFWKMTPRKLNALSRAHIKINSSGDKGDKPTGQGYADQIF